MNIKVYKLGFFLIFLIFIRLSFDIFMNLRISKKNWIIIWGVFFILWRFELFT